MGRTRCRPFGDRTWRSYWRDRNENRESDGAVRSVAGEAHRCAARGPEEKACGHGGGCLSVLARDVLSLDADLAEGLRGGESRAGGAGRGRSARGEFRN